MKMKCPFIKSSCLTALLLAVAGVFAANAAQRASANYSIATDIADGGGQRATSVIYTNSGSIGAITGVSTVASPVETAKAGYLGQLYEVSGLVVSGTASTVNETGTLQLAALQLLDDASYLAVSATSVGWSVVSGPITGITTGGLATSGTVYQDTPATVSGTLGGFTGSLNLTVLDTLPDNFGSYAGDGLPDSWQVQYFGQNNPNAAPTVDFDHTGQTNLFKYLAGLNPLDGSRFTLAIDAVPAQPAQKNLIFSPRLTDRTYTVTFKTDLNAASWTPLVGGVVNDNGQQRTVTDPAATDERKFYRIEITKP